MQTKSPRCGKKNNTQPSPKGRRDAERKKVTIKSKIRNTTGSGKRAWIITVPNHPID